nr:uncharacterized protein LOC116150302 [Camelus dromedarius]
MAIIKSARNDPKLNLGSRTAYDTQENITGQVERDTTLHINVHENVSGEHPILIAWDFCSRSELWIRPGNSCYHFPTELKTFRASSSDCGKKHSSLMTTDNGENRNRTQLFIRCLPSPVSWMNLNCTLNNTNQTAEDISNLSTPTHELTAEQTLLQVWIPGADRAWKGRLNSTRHAESREVPWSCFYNKKVELENLQIRHFA